MSATPEKKSVAAQRGYNKITEKDLNWWKTFYQWCSIRLFHLYFNWKYKVHVHGRENLPPGRSSHVVVSNHTSNEDPIFIAMVIDFRPLSFMAKEELFEKPLSAWFYTNVGSFSVNREKLELSTIKSALAVLKTGRWNLGIFPEGTRVKEGEAQKPKKGAAYFAHAANTSILPIGVYKSRDKKHLYAEIGALIPSQGDLNQLTEEMDQAIRTLVEQARRRAGE